jgi:fatty acyl-CoA reductase
MGSIAASDARCVLLTGVTGFLGKVVLYDLVRPGGTAGPIDRIYVLIRARKQHGPAERLAQVIGSPCFAGLDPAWSDRVSLLAGDLALPDCGLSASDVQRAQGEVTEVIHCAASVDFDLPLRRACQANITGSLSVLQLAKGCSLLRRMVSVSTAYVTPHRSGPLSESLAALPRPAAEIYEEALAGRCGKQEMLKLSGHPNTYTLTKCIAEHLLMERRQNVPLHIVRPSIISASSRRPFPGWIDSDAALAGFIAAIGGGYMHVVDANPACPLDVVPVDEVSDRILTAAFAPSEAPGAISFAVAGTAHSCTVAGWLQAIEAFFCRFPHDRVAKVRYVGGAGRLFAVRRAWHHVFPSQTAAAISWLRGNRRGQRQAQRLVQRLDRINAVFPYFTHHSFDFRPSQPLPAHFDVEAYVHTCCEGVATHLMGRRSQEIDFAGRAFAAPYSDMLWAISRPYGNLTIRCFAAALSKVLRRIFDRVTFDLKSFEQATGRLRALAGEERAVVLVPTHRSYMDFLVCSYLLFARPELGISLPHIAAAHEFSQIRVVGWLMRRMQAFYLRRGRGEADPQLTRDIHQLVDKQATLQFFIEGQRSRSRQFLQPHRGLLRCLQGTGKPFIVLPVSMSYDRIPEETTFLRELRGYPKDRMRLRGLVQWSRRMLRGEVQLGRLHVACGAPLLLSPKEDPHVFSRKVMQQLQEQTVITDYHLRYFIQAQLRDRPGAAVEQGALKAAIEARGCRVLDSAAPTPSAHALDPVMERTLRNQWAHLFIQDAALRQPQNLALAHHAGLTAFAAADRPRLPDAANSSAAAPDAWLLQLEAALFATVCHDYQALAQALRRSLGRPASTVPEDSLLRHAGYQDYTTACSALDALVEAQLVGRVDRQHLEVLGSPADLHQFALACAWSAPAHDQSRPQWPRAVPA